MPVCDQRLPKRYDELDPDKPFHKKTVYPVNKEFRKVNKNVRDRFIVGKETYHDDLALHEKLALAEVNLRTRGLVGIVLGSTVAKLYAPPRNMSEIHKHTDIDCLILNTYSPNHPAPMEWAIDWFVRPPDGRPPTNGLVRLCYDIGMRPDMKVSHETTRSQILPFYLDTKEMQLKFHEYPEDLTEKYRQTVREKIGVILPGLYLPSAAIMGKIADVAVIRNELIERKLKQARELTGVLKDQQNPPEEIILRLIEALNALTYSCNLGIKIAFKNWDTFMEKIKDPGFYRIFMGRVEAILCRIEMHHGEKGKNDYSYLIPKSPDTTHCLYPVLEDEYLQFKPLISRNED
jgi:hypothetical protein